METNQTQEVSGCRLRDMVRAVKWDRKKKRAERIEVLNKVNDRYFDWVDAHKEIGFEVRLKERPVVEIEVVEFEDGKWISDCSVQLSDRGFSHGLNAPNELFESKEDAVRSGVADALIYLLQQAKDQHVNDTVKVQVNRCGKACMELFFAPSKKQAVLF